MHHKRDIFDTLETNIFTVPFQLISDLFAIIKSFFPRLQSWLPHIFGNVAYIGIGIFQLKLLTYIYKEDIAIKL